jgi:hypothetical protein
MRSIAALVLLLQIVLAAPAGEHGQSSALEFKERIVAGGPEDFMLVKHLVLRGSNFAIGQRLAEIAKQEHGVVLSPSDADRLTGQDRLKLRVLKQYYYRHFPIHHTRMQGVAAFHGMSSGDDPIDFSGVFYNLGYPESSGPGDGGCSVVFFPPQSTATGTGIMSRNYDFTTGTLDGRTPAPGKLGATSRPYVMELYPDQGYASLAVCSYDLVGGAIDGVNSAGLCVALLADDESASTQPIEPAMGVEVGLYELNIPRFLLDTCGSCEEARAMLLTAKHYYSFVPVHYIIADRHGNSFVWEYSYSNNKEYVVDGAGLPQVVTNHPLYKWKGAELPVLEEAKLDSYERYQTLTRKIQSNSGKCSLDFIKETTALVAANLSDAPPPGRASFRTLWHALYYPEDRKAEVDFYLGDRPDPARPGQTQIARSGYTEFQLDKNSWSSHP